MRGRIFTRNRVSGMAFAASIAFSACAGPMVDSRQGSTMPQSAPQVSGSVVIDGEAVVRALKSGWLG